MTAHVFSAICSQMSMISRPTMLHARVNHKSGQQVSLAPSFECILLRSDLEHKIFRFVFQGTKRNTRGEELRGRWHRTGVIGLTELFLTGLSYESENFPGTEQVFLAGNNRGEERTPRMRRGYHVAVPPERIKQPSYSKALVLLYR